MSSSKDLICSICKKEFATTSNLFRHIRQIHKQEVYVFSQNIISCPLCEEEKEINIHNYKHLDEHLTNKHGLDIKKESYQFLSEKDFINWKVNIEHETNSRYSRHDGSNHTKLFKTTYYYCHRSGYYKSKGNNLRHLKSQGSCKINANCPSRIKAIINKQTAEVTVEFVITHLNHEQDLGHLFLTDQDRQWIAAKLMEGVTVDRIMDEARSSVDNKINRLHLLTKKDIANIENSFKSSIKISNDKLNILLNECSSSSQEHINDVSEFIQKETMKNVSVTSENNEETHLQGLKRMRGDTDNLK